MTNFQYLTELNKMAGRSFNDLMQYPVFPFVLADFGHEVLDLNDVKSFRYLYLVLLLILLRSNPPVSFGGPSLDVLKCRLNFRASSIMVLLGGREREQSAHMYMCKTSDEIIFTSLVRFESKGSLHLESQSKLNPFLLK